MVVRACVRAWLRVLVASVSAARPVRGCAGQELQSSSEFDKNGFLQDRRYMFVRCVEGEGDAVRGPPA